MSIGGLSRRTGLATSAIRYYESRGLIESARTEGGQRRYDDTAALALRQLTFAQSSGFTLTEISELLGPMKSDETVFSGWEDLARRKLVELDEVIKQAQEMKRYLMQALECKCTEPAQCGLL